MAIEIKETFQVQAPVDAVWRFVMDPHKVVTCIPGASLEEVVDERTFVGKVKVKVGAVTSSYKGRVTFEQIDPQAHTVKMVAEGRETGGGTAKGTMSSVMRSLPDGRTEVVAKASVDLTGRIMQVGRGMIQAVSNQLFQQFVAALKKQVETQSESPAQTEAAPQPAPPSEPQAIAIVPLLLRTLWVSILRFFRRLFGRQDG